MEKVSAKYVRACAAAPGGEGNVLNEGKLQWLALYNETVSNTEQFGTIKFSQMKSVVAGKLCFPVSFPVSSIMCHPIHENS